MKNKEKFKEVFGHDVETNACPQKDVECEKCELFNDRTCTETFWNSEYIPPMNQIEPVRAYPCNPEKNTDCKKTGCYERGGFCKLTLTPEYAKEERNGKNES